jgi:ATP/maltotriose-dependent transcriptional regulator MalT
LSNHEIAGRIHVAETTVKTHVNHILAKTGLGGRACTVASCSPLSLRAWPGR